MAGKRAAVVHASAPALTIEALQVGPTLGAAGSRAGLLPVTSLAAHAQGTAPIPLDLQRPELDGVKARCRSTLARRTKRTACLGWVLPCGSREAPRNRATRDLFEPTRRPDGAER